MSPQCQCGNRVSPTYARVYSGNQGDLRVCPECQPTRAGQWDVDYNSRALAGSHARKQTEGDGTDWTYDPAESGMNVQREQLATPTVDAPSGSGSASATAIADGGREDASEADELSDANDVDNADDADEPSEAGEDGEQDSDESMYPFDLDDPVDLDTDVEADLSPIDEGEEIVDADEQWTRAAYGET